MTVIGDFLRVLREEHRLTQEHLAELLAGAVEEFSALNAVTVSRWETGATSPSYKKKRALLTFCMNRGWLEEGPVYAYVRNRFENLCTPLAGIFQHNYQALIANVPRLRVPLEEYELLDLQQRKELFYYEHIVDIEAASNPPGYYMISPDTLRQLCRSPDSFSLLCERRKQHLGHFIMFKLNSDAARRLVHNQLSENRISTDDLCTEDERGSYYIHALYGVNPTIAALLNSRAYLYLYDQKKNIDTIVIFSSRADGRRLARAYGIRTVAWGKNREYDFSWYGMESPVADILFSDTVLKLIF